MYITNLQIICHWHISVYNVSVCVCARACVLHNSVLLVVFTSSIFSYQDVSVSTCSIKVFSQFFSLGVSLSDVASESFPDFLAAYKFLDLNSLSIPHILFHYHLASRIANKYNFWDFFESCLFFPSTKYFLTSVFQEFNQMYLDFCVCVCVCGFLSYLAGTVPFPSVDSGFSTVQGEILLLV